MATVKPFIGVTYAEPRVGDTGLVTCPPYDVISPNDRSRLYAMHPYNAVRFIAGAEEPEDDNASNRYTRAAAYFKAWQDEGVLVRDAEPAMYIYRQSFRDPVGQKHVVTGLIATISLDDPILAHEHTMAGPKADRLALMDTTDANLSPIYVLYSGGGIDVDSPTHHDPLVAFNDEDHVLHEVWRVTDGAFHADVAAKTASLPIAIADGHHRFATAQNYREQHGSDGGRDEILVLLVDAKTEPVCILPYHRIVRNASGDVVAALKANFDLTSLGNLSREEFEAHALSLWQTSGFLARVEGECYHLTAAGTEGEIPAQILLDRVLEPIGATSAEHHLSFTPRAGDVFDAVTAGAIAGFCMPPVSVAVVWDKGEAGVKMPEKSTYFYPKPRDGIVMRPFS